MSLIAEKKSRKTNVHQVCARMERRIAGEPLDARLLSSLRCGFCPRLFVAQIWRIKIWSIELGRRA